MFRSTIRILLRCFSVVGHRNTSGETSPVFQRRTRVFASYFRPTPATTRPLFALCEYRVGPK
ncbi:hypothetical protein C1H46_030710 [Malus baccata]|uniref:Uncharacterized protein n=1 Tax=Malus baccata TaxID=106549 RepID=A0A540LBA0_MALBA|nr:hypothetical protein C1H46_030710 [Malus baccata]